MSSLGETRQRVQENCVIFGNLFESTVISKLKTLIFKNPEKGLQSCKKEKKNCKKKNLEGYSAKRPMKPVKTQHLKKIKVSKREEIIKTEEIETLITASHFKASSAVHYSPGSHYVLTIRVCK